MSINQYAITWGARSLREAIARKMAAYNRIACDPETQITVTCGATEAMIATLLALLDPGEEVIIFEPFYENYGPGYHPLGGQARLRAAAGARLRPGRRALRRAFSPRHACHHRQHAAQPQRPRLHPRRA